MDYTRWTTEELNALRAMQASQGAGQDEIDAVERELVRRTSAQGMGWFDQARVVPPAHLIGVDPPTETNRKRLAALEHVGVAPRFIALAIDGGLFVVLALIVVVLTGAGAGDGGALFWALIGFVYTVTCEVLFGGTPGKLALGLRVVDDRGDSITWGAAIVRNVLRILDGFFFYLVGAIAIWSSPLRQRLGDRAAGTYVVRL